ncbi:MAG: hypothetical protein ACOYK6_03290, partial [Chthoniobacterales bacterium]
SVAAPCGVTPNVIPAKAGIASSSITGYTAGLRSSFDSLCEAHLALAGLPNGSLPDRLPSGRVLTLHRLQLFLKRSKKSFVFNTSMR